MNVGGQGEVAPSVAGCAKHAPLGGVGHTSPGILYSLRSILVHFKIIYIKLPVPRGRKFLARGGKCPPLPPPLNETLHMNKYIIEILTWFCSICCSCVC